MGMYTYHSLKIVLDECDTQKYSASEIIAQLRSEYEEAEVALDENGDTADEAKWYECSEEMKEFSKKYPNVLFKMTLEAAQSEEEFEGECDIYYKNGEEFTLDEEGGKVLI